MTRQTAAKLAIIALCALASSACVRHVLPYNHKVRSYDSPDFAAPDAARSPGSLWSEGAHNLFEDARARRVGDILTVRVDESAAATRDSATRTQRQSDMEVGVSNFLGAMQSLAAKYPGLDPNAIFAATTQMNFNGSGNTTRSGQVNAVLPVRIRSALPNGDFFVEGNKVLLVNAEESFLYLSGVVRPIDIEPDNSVSSSLLADVELEYTGRGVLAETESPGWFNRIMSYIWPF